MTILEEFAPAKVNLALHVTGRRDDGYHLLDTLVTFAGVGDQLRFKPANAISISIDGPESSKLTAGGDNLVMQAMQVLVQDAEGPLPGVNINLEKMLPLASGIGGGSADAAAALRGLNRYWELDLSPGQMARTGLLLGADVPMCLAGTPLHATGIGERLEPLSMPCFDIVLANPRIGVSTRDVFSRLGENNNPPLPHVPHVPSGDYVQWLEYLREQRNDLQAIATTVVPQISDCIGALQESAGCDLARMSGSGSTCFGIFANAERAQSAAATIRAQNPDWWVVATGTRSG